LVPACPGCELVKILGTNQTTIGYYENGGREPRIGYLMAKIKKKKKLCIHVLKKKFLFFKMQY
jgi:hypothetical protein